MNEIKCPKCGEVFQVSEDGYAHLLEQVRDEQFQRELEERLASARQLANAQYETQRMQGEQEKAQLQAQVERLQQQIAANEAQAKVQRELAVQEASQRSREQLEELQRQVQLLTQEMSANAQAAQAEKDLAVEQTKARSAQQVAELRLEVKEARTQLDAFAAQAQAQQQLAVEQERSKSQEQRVQIERERDQLAAQIKTMEVTASERAAAHKIALAEKDEEIERVRSDKAKLSTKMLGESLEQHCEIAFNQVRSYAFPRAEFGKDNDASGGTKGDYIFREYDEEGVEVLSIMFEMKNEAEGSTHTKKNADHFKKLDKDRCEKKCEYAVLVSMLEPESELYNGGIVDVSHVYPKMFVIRPQFFIPLIGLLRNAAYDALAYKREVVEIRKQNVDVTKFEDKLAEFKTGFSRNFDLASRQFDEAIKEIDNAIARLNKVRESLTKSERNLGLAGNKLDKLTVRSLTWGNPTMKKMFDEAREQKVVAEVAEGAELVEAECLDED